MEIIKYKDVGDLLASSPTTSDLIQNCMNMQQVDTPVTHSFLDNQYIRELRVPKGTFLVGHYQRFDHLNVFVKGKVAMLNSDGSWKVIEAPMTFIGSPGRKIGYVLEDMVWINSHSTSERDIDKIEDYIYDKSILQSASINRIQLDKIEDQVSYHETILKLGFTDEEVQAMVTVDNVIPMPDGKWGTKTARSPIHGEGIFATDTFEPGYFIGPVRIGDKRTPLGRFINHSKNPNAEFRCIDGDLYLYATKSINGCKGMLNGDEITVDYLHSFQVSTESLEV